MRLVLRAAASVVAVLVVLAGLNVAGVLLIPTGPLGSHATGPDPASFTRDHDASPVFLAPFVTNEWAVPVTITRITPIGVAPAGAVEILGGRPFDDRAAMCRIGFVTDLPEDCSDLAAPGATSAVGMTVGPADDPASGVQFLARLDPDPVVETRVERFEVEYTLGPFRFVTVAVGTAGTTLTACGMDRPVAGGEGELDSCR